MEELYRRIIRIPSHRQLVRAHLEGKRVLVRFDFNVPIENNKIQDAKRIEAAIPTLKKILEKGASEVNIICHLGRPVFDSEAQTRGEGKLSQQFSTELVAYELSVLLGLHRKIKTFEADSKYSCLKKLYLLGDRIKIYENLRFDKEEEKNDPKFAKALSDLGDVFVQDAFANIHRNHASMVAVAKILPTYAGLLVEKEVNSLFRLLYQPKEPFVAIIAGAKIKDKLPVIEALSKKVQAVIVGGKTANEWILEGHKRTGNIYLPTDGVNKLGSIVPINEQTLKAGIFDIGPQTIMLYKSIISSAKTVFWNGNLGMTENKRFIHGTYEIARFIAKLRLEKVASGGNTAEVIDELKLQDQFNFISTGGGATDDFIIGKKMPALEILLK